MKLKFELDTETRRLVADLTDAPNPQSEIEMMRAARRIAGLLQPVALELEIIAKPKAAPQQKAA